MVLQKMWIVLSLVFLCLPCATGHVSLIYPPARKYDFDFMDNSRTPGPCGVPKGLGPSTTLLAGSTINVNFHLAYPHKGGFFLEVMNNNTNAILRYPQSGVLSSTNTTLRSAQLTLPNQECRGCWIRLVRQAAEWGANCRRGYVFWSCADVDIIQTDFTESCNGHGTWRTNKCECERLWVGDRCEHKVDCKDASDCNDHGECVDIATDPNPIKHCYCQHGWHGIQCDKTSSVRSKNIDYSLYKERELSPDYMLYYRYIAISEEIEMVLKANSSNWVAIGWRPQSFRSGCQLFPNLPNARKWSAGEDEVKTQDTTAKPEGEDEATAKPEGEAEATAKPESETEAEATAKPESETEAEPTSKPESETEAEPTSKPESETEAEPTTKPEYETEAESKPETEPESETETPEPKSEVTSEPESEGKVTPEPETESEVTPEPETESEVKPEPETESEVTPEPETEGEVKPEPESEGGTQSCVSPLPALGYSTGGSIYGNNDRHGSNLGNGMDCSDIIVGTARGETSRISDYYTRDRSTPKHDSIYGGEDSLTGALGFENDGQTVIIFRRKVQATHRSDHTIERKSMSVIWAHGQIEDNYRHAPASGDKPGFYVKDQLLYHGASPNRGTLTLNFLENARDLSTSCNGNWPNECDDCELEMSWVYNKDTDDISFTMKARLNGESKWIGVGFSKDNNMAESDAIVGWVDNGQVHVTDRWMTGRVEPKKDAQDDIKNKRGSVKDGVTTISFDRARDTGDSNDLAFSDTQCLYMFYAVGGGYNSSDESIKKHGNTPSVSSSKVCIRSCDVVASGVRLISTVEVTLDNQYDAKLSDRESEEFKKLEGTMKEWMDMVFKSLPGYQETRIIQFKQGSIIVVADVDSIRDGDSVSSKVQYKADLEKLLESGQSSPPQGYTINSYTVGDPRSVQAPTFRLTLIEEIVIGLAVSLLIVIIIVAVCKLSESKREKVKAASSNKHQRFNGDNSSGSSTTSLSNQKQNLDHGPPVQSYTNAAYSTSNSSNGTQRSTITYDEFIKTKNIP